MNKTRLILLLFCVLTLQSNTQCSAPAPSTEVTPGGETMPALTVSLQKRSAINTNLYGFNAANFFFHFQPKDQGLQQLMTGLESPILRFPGGTTANFYHPASKGYGFSAEDVERTAGSNMQKTMSRNVKQEQQYIQKGWIKENFIRQFSWLAKQQKSKVLYVANLFSGTDQEVIDAVQYLLDQGVDVVGIELGNEYYLRAYTGTYPDAQPYIKRAQQIAPKLRAKFPNIPLAAVAAPCPEAKGSGPAESDKYNRWNQTLSAAKFYDAIVTHLYATPKKCVDAGGTSAVFECALHSTSEFASKQLKLAMNYYASYYGEERKVWVTEWNVQGVFQYFGNTFLQAAYYCQFATALNQFQQVEFATCHNLLSRGAGFNLIGRANQKEQALTTNSKYIPRMTYHAAELLLPLFEGNVNQLEIEGPVASSHHYVAAYEKADQLLLLIINRSGQTQHLQQLSLPSEAQTKKVEWKRIEAQQLTSGIGINPTQNSPVSDQVKLLESSDQLLEAIQLQPYSINLLQIPIKKTP